MNCQMEKRFRTAGAILPFLLLAGCVSTTPVAPSEAASPPPAATSASAEITLAEALRRAKAEQLDAETVESLGLIAGEHLHNLTLLRLPGIADDQRSGTELPPERLLDLLDGAIAYNQLLSAAPGSDLEEERRPRIGQLLAWENTANWTKLAAVREKIALLGGGTPEQRQEEGNLLLELRVATGLSRDGIAQFDYATLAKPRLLACELSELQQRAVRVRFESALAGFPAELPGKIRELPGMKGAEILRLAELLYRLPRHLAELQLVEPNRDLRKLAQLGSATGIAFEVEFSLSRLRTAWERYDLTRQKAELNPGSVECSLALIDARRDWRLAYYRLLTDLGADPTVPFQETSKNGEELPPQLSDELLDLMRQAAKE